MLWHLKIFLYFVNILIKKRVLFLKIEYSKANDLPEVEPRPEEAKIVADYENGVEEYQPYISHEALKQQLNLQPKIFC